MLKSRFLCAFGSSSPEFFSGVDGFLARMLSMLKDGFEFDARVWDAAGSADASLVPRSAAVLRQEVPELRSTLLTSRFSRLPGRAFVFSSRRCFALLF